MPAVYGIDLIAKRDKKIKMDRSIVKRWNVHYQTLEEVEEESRAQTQKQAEEVQKSAEQLSEEGELSNKRQQAEEEEKRKKEAYNPKTGAYSGHYGQRPVHDEGQKQQIHAILNEKPEPFEFAMSTLQAQSADGQ